ncbi:MAG: threonine/serine dehydratase [Terriglobales bacterium]|jgi:threonine dehydratase
MVSLEEIRQAHARLQGVAVRTPLIKFPRSISATAPATRLWFKPENLQPIGAFKLRGAYNKIASLGQDDRLRGVITYSSGNHGQGVAYAARALAVQAIVVMPRNAPKIKIESTSALGAQIVFVGPSSAERQSRAEEFARQHGYVIIPPYDDEQIIAGQGTVGLEIISDLPTVGCVLVPVGGGGLISGVATAIKLSDPQIKVIGVEPELAADAQTSLRAGHIVDFPGEQTARTLADGLRTQHLGVLNFEHIRRYVDDIVTVSEQEIRAAVRSLALDAKLVAEPSGAVAFAAYLFRGEELPKSDEIVAVISGGNIEPGLLAEILLDNDHSARN